MGTAAGVGGLLRARAGRKNGSRSKSGSPPGDGSDAQTDQEHHGSANGNDNKPGTTGPAKVSAQCVSSAGPMSEVLSLSRAQCLHSSQHTGCPHQLKYSGMQNSEGCYTNHVCRCCCCTAIHGCAAVG